MLICVVIKLFNCKVDNAAICEVNKAIINGVDSEIMSIVGI